MTNVECPMPASVSRYGTVIDSEPATPEYVAEITTGPLAMLLTSPLGVTIATAVLEDVHVDSVVTSSTAPLAVVAVALN